MHKELKSDRNLFSTQLALTTVERKLFVKMLEHHKGNDTTSKTKVEKKREPTSHRETSKSPGRLQFLGLRNGGLRGDNDRVENKPVLVSLDFTDHLGLVFGRAVVMDNT